MAASRRRKVVPSSQQACEAGRAGAAVVLVTAQSQTSWPLKAALIRQREVSSGVSHDSVLSLGLFRIFICNIDEDTCNRLIKFYTIRS